MAQNERNCTADFEQPSADLPAAKPADRFYAVYVKRILDCVVALVALLLCLLPMCAVALCVKCSSPGSVLFRQMRLGKNGRPFVMLKFRSMYIDTEHTGMGVYSKTGDPRVTRVGRFLRTTAMDELPQLINVLRGDMSLIGPRPPLTYHPWPPEQYTEEQKQMFDLRPGLTGWAQMHGGRDTEWNHRIAMNVWYVRHVRLLLDLKIVGLTLKSFLQKGKSKR